MKVLAFDSSNQALTVAIIENETILTEQIINVRRNHSIQLMPAIDEAFKQSKLSLADIDRIAVASGPGSYTGLRIAVTIAKTLAWASDIEIVGISSLKVLAVNSQGAEEKLIVPLFDARRDNLYTGLYRRDEAGTLITIEEDTHIAADQWTTFLKTNYPDQMIELVGVDAEKFYPVFEKELKENVKLAPTTAHLPRGSELALLAQTAEVTPAHELIPTYLKLAEAEENWLKEHPDFKGGDFVETV